MRDVKAQLADILGIDEDEVEAFLKNPNNLFHNPVMDLDDDLVEAFVKEVKAIFDSPREGTVMVFDFKGDAELQGFELNMDNGLLLMSSPSSMIH